MCHSAWPVKIKIWIMVIIAVKNQIAIIVLLHDHEGNLKTQKFVLNEDNGIEVLFDKLDIFFNKKFIRFQKHPEM